MTNVQKPAGLGAFYQERFNSDPYNLLACFDAEIASAAADASINWSSVCNAVRLNGKRLKTYSKVKVVALDARYNGKVAVWGDLKKTKPKKAEHSAIEYPYLTFLNNVTGPSTWSGFDALIDLWKRERGLQPSDAEAKRLEQQKARQAEREARRAAEEAAEKITAERIYNERMTYERAWLTGEGGEFEYEGTRSDNTTYVAKAFVEVLGDEDGTAPYLVKKQISDIASRFQMKRMRDRHGVFTAVPLFDIHSNFLGLQRLYEDKKLQGNGVKMDGAHCIFGDLETADLRYSVEGFATGASIYLAELEAKKNVAVVVTFNVGNLVKVLQTYARRCPAWRFLNAADDDQWKTSGNAGLLAALEIHREFQHPGIVPPFELDDLAKAAARETGKGPTDWNDYHVMYGLKATAKALHARASVRRAEKDWFTYCLQRVQLSGRFAEKAAKMAINAGMLLVPIKYSVDDVIARVLEQMPDTAPVALLPKLRSLAQWIGRQKLSQAQQLRSFSPEALRKPNVQYVTVQAVPHPVHGGPMVPGHLAELIGSLEGTIILRAPMGSGKTEEVIAPVLQAATKGAYIAHRVSLMDDAAARLNIDRDGFQAEKQVDHYKWVMQSHMPYVSHLVCCVNSLTASKFYNAEERSWFTTLETLCIDEASQVIRHTTTGPVDGRVRVMDSLIDAVASAKRVLLCDADANDTVIEFCEMARPGQTITVIEVVGQNSAIRVDHADDEAVWQMAIDEVVAGRRVLIANDSAESAKKMAALLENMAENGEIPAPRMLLVHSEVKADPEVEAFLSNPKDEALKYDVLIYSPAISSGVSMNQPHFERHFGLFGGNSVGPSDALQMLRRDRTARHYIIGIGHSSAQRETNPEVMYRGMLVAEDLVCKIENTPEEYRMVRKKTAFDKMYLSTVAIENKARNNFANNLLLMLEGEGYQVQRLSIEDHDELADISRENRKFAGELVFSKRMTLIDSVATPTEEEFLKLNRMELRSESESAQVDRFHIEHQLCVDEIRADDVDFYDNRGIAKIVALELLQSTEEQAKAYDLAQRKAKVVLTQHRFKTSPQSLLVKVFDILTIDRKTGSGFFTSDQCRAVLELIKADQDTLDLYNTLKLGRYVPTLASKVCATTLVKSILERLGLATKKKKSNGRNIYRINDKHWTFVMSYVQRRAAKNVHSLTTHEHESTHSPLMAPEEPQAAAPAGLLEQYRDTLQCEGVSTDLKYPLNVAERLFAVASACDLPPGTPIARLIGALRPDVAQRYIEPGVDMTSVKWTLGYAAKLLETETRYTV